LLGMVPLLFIDSTKADRLKEKARLERLYQDVLNEAKSLVEAESTCLYLRVDKDEKADGSNSNSKAPPKERGLGILPDYHPSVNGQYLYAMYYVEPHQQRKQGHSTTETLMRMVSSGSRISQRNNISSGDGDVSGDHGRITAPPAAIAVDVAKVIVPTPASPSSPSQLPHRARVIPVEKGVISRAVLTGTTWTINGNLMDEPDFYPERFATTNRERFRDCSIVPILDGRGNVIAVLEALNKERSKGNDGGLDGDGGFTDQDVEILVSLASHVSVSLQRIYQDGEEDEEDFGLRDTIRILKKEKGMKRSITKANEKSKANAAVGTVFDGGASQEKKIQLFPD